MHQIESVWTDTRILFTSLSKNTTLSEQTRGYYLRHCQKILHCLNRHEDIIYVTVKKYYTVWTDTRILFTSLSKNTTLSEQTRGYYLRHCQKRLLHCLNRHEEIIYVTVKKYYTVWTDTRILFTSLSKNTTLSEQTRGYYLRHCQKILHCLNRHEDIIYVTVKKYYTVCTDTRILFTSLSKNTTLSEQTRGYYLRHCQKILHCLNRHEDIIYVTVKKYYTVWTDTRILFTSLSKNTTLSEQTRGYYLRHCQKILHCLNRHEDIIYVTVKKYYTVWTDTRILFTSLSKNTTLSEQTRGYYLRHCQKNTTLSEQTRGYYLRHCQKILHCLNRHEDIIYVTVKKYYTVWTDTRILFTSLSKNTTLSEQTRGYYLRHCQKILHCLNRHEDIIYVTVKKYYTVWTDTRILFTSLSKNTTLSEQTRGYYLRHCQKILHCLNRHEDIIYVTVKKYYTVWTDTRILFTSLSKNTTLSEQTRGYYLRHCQKILDCLNRHEDIIYVTVKKYYTVWTDTRILFTSLSKNTTLSEQTRGYYLRHCQKILHCLNRHEDIIYVTVKKYYTVWTDTRILFTSLSKNTTLSEQTRGYYLRHCQKILHCLNRHEDIIYVTVKKYYTVWTDTRILFTSLSKNTTLSEQTRGYYLRHCQKILHCLNRHEDIIYVTVKKYYTVWTDTRILFTSLSKNTTLSEQTRGYYLRHCQKILHCLNRHEDIIYVTVKKYYTVWTDTRILFTSLSKNTTLSEQTRGYYLRHCQKILHCLNRHEDIIYVTVKKYYTVWTDTRILFTSLSKNTTLSEQTRGYYLRHCQKILDCLNRHEDIIYVTVKKYYTVWTDTRILFTSLSKNTTLSEQTRGYYLRHCQKILHCLNRHEDIIYVTVKKYYTVWTDTRILFTSLSKNTTLSEQTRGYYLRHCQKILHCLNRHEDIIYVTVKKYYTVWTDTRILFTSLSKNTTLSEQTRGYYLRHCQKILHCLNRHEDIIYVTVKKYYTVWTDTRILFTSLSKNTTLSEQTRGYYLRHCQKILHCLNRHEDIIYVTVKKYYTVCTDTRILFTSLSKNTRLSE